MSFLWYDLETFGRDPRRSRIAQFAALRTDDDLHEIGEPVSLFCKPASDLLPSPLAALVTGITPQRAQAEGLSEPDFIGRVQDCMAEPGTCSAGYNSLRFDDEFVRFSLYRNFHDPYEREWRNGNSRWDLLDVLRLAHALRPDALVWPTREDGFTSFKLEDLAKANGVREGQAHEALSDVRALLGLARKLRDAQPRFWDYALELRSKRTVMSRLDVISHTPVLHVSGRLPAAHRHGGLMAPLGLHPALPGRVVALDLSVDPAAFAALSQDELRQRVFSRRDALPLGQIRLPLKEIQANRCPAIVPLAHVRSSELDVLGIDLTLAQARAEWLRMNPDFVAACVALFDRRFDAGDAVDPDLDLYGGFATDADRRLFPGIRTAAPESLHGFASRLQDPRLIALLFRYQARNYGESLTAGQAADWVEHRRAVFDGRAGSAELDAGQFAVELAQARQRVAESTSGADAAVLLDQVEAFASAQLGDVGLALPS